MKNLQVRDLTIVAMLKNYPEDKNRSGERFYLSRYVHPNREKRLEKWLVIGDVKLNRPPGRYASRYGARVNYFNARVPDKKYCRQTGGEYIARPPEKTRQ